MGADYFYCTDPDGEFAWQMGYTNGSESPLEYSYRPENRFIAAYVYKYQEPKTIPICRWFHPIDGHHFYCPAGKNRKAFWFEGVEFYCYAKEEEGTTPMYRMYNPTTQIHFYTVDLDEVERKLTKGWKMEQDLGYVFYKPGHPGTVPLYRWIKPSRYDQVPSP